MEFCPTISVSYASNSGGTAFGIGRTYVGANPPLAIRRPGAFYPRTFLAQINRQGIHRHIGLFVNEIEAAKAYDKAASTLFGEYCHLNFERSLSS
jgi:hypothetical protein